MTQATERPSCPHCGASAVTGTAVSTRPVVLAAQWQCGQGHTWLLEAERADLVRREPLTEREIARGQEVARLVRIQEAERAVLVAAAWWEAIEAEAVNQNWTIAPQTGRWGEARQRLHAAVRALREAEAREG